MFKTRITRPRRPAKQRRLAFESLEDRRLLAIDVTNLGLEAFGFSDAFQLDGDLLAIEVSESSRQLDLNNDGDLDDIMMHVHDANTGAGTDLPLAVTEFSLEGDILALLVSEQAQGGTDLNGDGDVFLDRVLHAYNATTGATTNLGLTAASITLGGNRIAFTVSEVLQGHEDLNGDGDSFDSVLHVYDVTSG